MRNPGEMFAAANFKASLLKRCRVLLERGQVLFFSVPLTAKLILQRVAKSGEAVVHIDHHAESSRCEQTQNVARTVQLLSAAMAISDCVYADDELEGVLQT